MFHWELLYGVIFSFSKLFAWALIKKTSAKFSLWVYRMSIEMGSGYIFCNWSFTLFQIVYTIFAKLPDLCSTLVYYSVAPAGPSKRFRTFLRQSFRWILKSLKQRLVPYIWFKDIIKKLRICILLAWTLWKILLYSFIKAEIIYFVGCILWYTDRTVTSLLHSLGDL